MQVRRISVFLALAVGLVQAQSASNATGSATAQAAASPAAQTQIDEVWLRQLPVNRRNYFDFSLLSPGVTSANQISGTGSNDQRVPSTPHSAFSFDGNNGRGNGATVNGGEANDDFGGMRLTLGQEAVKEFNVEGGSASTRNGAASGASFQSTTKTGTNQIHGSAFGFFSNDALNAANPLSFGSALQPGLAPNTFYDPTAADVAAQSLKTSLSRQQFGGSFGFPLQKDKTFMFLSYEGLRGNGQVSAPTLSNTNIYRPTTGQTAILNGLTGEGATPVPCLTGQPALPASTCASILQNILTINPASSPLNQFITQQFSQNSGLFPYTGSNDFATSRLDHRFSDNNQVYLMYNFGQDLEQNSNINGFTTFSRGSRVNEFGHTLQGGWTHQFTPSVVNQALLQWDYTRYDMNSNNPGAVGLDIFGYASFGSSLYSPSSSLMHHYQASDNLTFVHGNHTMTVGGSVLLRGNRNDTQALSAGTFTFGNLAGGILSPCLQVPAACGLTATQQDITSLQSTSLGLPQYYQQGFTNNAYVAYTTPLSSVFWQDAWKVRSNLTLNFGVRYDVDGRYSPLKTDTNNFAPRFAFAWDPTKSHKTVVRGGFGISYAPLGAQMDYLAHALADVNGTRQIPVVMVPLNSGGPLTSAAVFQTLFAQGKVQCTNGNGSTCITAGDLAQFGITPSQTGAIPAASALFGANTNIQNPYSQQGNFGIQRELSSGLTVSADYIHVHTLRLPQSTDANLLPAPLVATGPAGIPINNWSGCPGCFVNPNLVQNNVVNSTGSALYDAGIFRVNKRFSNHFSVLANYTYSKAIDDVTDYNVGFAAFNQLNPAADRSVSSFDQRHSLMLAAVVQSPWQGGSGASLGSKILSGFGLSPVIHATSGHPFNALAGTDLNGDNNPLTDRPAGAGRNTGIGPDFVTMDLRLSRQFNLTEKGRLQFIAEGFNLFNRANFTGLNNFVGNVAGPFNYQASASASASEPLGYTAAGARRQMQFGIRFEF
jgi:hypothetical protein